MESKEGTIILELALTCPKEPKEKGYPFQAMTKNGPTRGTKRSGLGQGYCHGHLVRISVALRGPIMLVKDQPKEPKCFDSTPPVKTSRQPASNFGIYDD